MELSSLRFLYTYENKSLHLQILDCSIPRYCRRLLDSVFLSYSLSSSYAAVSLTASDHEMSTAYIYAR